MSADTDSMPTDFVERRRSSSETASPGRERRQFANSHSELSGDAQELAAAIDAYKIRHRRRFIDYEEMLVVLRELGYERRLTTY